MPPKSSQSGQSSSGAVRKVPVVAIPRKRSRSPVKKGSSKLRNARGTSQSNAIMIDDDDVEPEAPRPSIDTPVSIPNSPQLGVSSSQGGLSAWRLALQAAKSSWGTSGAVEGYGGLEGRVSRFQVLDDASAGCEITFEDIEGEASDILLEMKFSNFTGYPREYNIDVRPLAKGIPRRISRTLARFSLIQQLDLKGLVLQLVHALQGDDDAKGLGTLEDADATDDDEAEDAYYGDVVMEDPAMPEAQTAETLTPESLALLREDFAQAKTMGYRPGLTQVSDHWIVSYSIPFKQIGIHPNTLAMWDDSLVQAWRVDERFTLLIQIYTYPPSPNALKFWLGSYPAYKPPRDVIIATERGNAGGLNPVFLSRPLYEHLRDGFPSAWRLVTAHDMSWEDADRIVFDSDLRRKAFEEGVVPPGCSRRDPKDPIHLGFGKNISLCAFFWTLHRFRGATNFCQTCGAAVEVVSLRPYVCSKPLCLYRFMSLGFGPSAEYIIQTHPRVVDILLSLAWASAKGNTRMDLPLQLHIDLPNNFRPNVHAGKLLDQLAEPEQRPALAWLIEQLPRVSVMKERLDGGEKLSNLVPSGSLGVLRWVIGSCRAYLKDVRPGDGIQIKGPLQAGQAAQHPRQFAFVVGSPEQESAFQEEIQKAQVAYARCREHPTMLVYHGSALERWHNILRSGLDFSEVANARAYGHGVYFASDDQISRGYTMRSVGGSRANADFQLNSVMAVVELINVPETFVSNSPYYVVNNVRQIKPFLLLAYGTDVPLELGTSEDPSKEEVSGAQPMAPTAEPAPAPLLPFEKAGAFFKHDPSLQLQPKYGAQPLQLKMPSTLEWCGFLDDEEDDEEQQALLRSPLPPPPNKVVFEPSPHTRYERLTLMPPPTETSTLASKALQREFKQVVTLQQKGELPFYVDPENPSLYCWTVELFGFNEDSILKKEMEYRGIKSIIAEIRFPAAFPNSPPFMRILHPRCKPFAAGGGGNVTAGGSICNEILTASGWNPVFCVEAMVRDIMTNMTEATPPACLDPHRWDQPYSLSEALEAYKRVAMQHGWQVPKDFDKMTR